MLLHFIQYAKWTGGRQYASIRGAITGWRCRSRRDANAQFDAVEVVTNPHTYLQRENKQILLRWITGQKWGKPQPAERALTIRHNVATPTHVPWRPLASCDDDFDCCFIDKVTEVDGRNNTIHYFNCAAHCWFCERRVRYLVIQLFKYI